MEYYGTLGPACREVGILKGMLQAGMTGIRLNLSHGGLEEKGHWLRIFQQAAEESGCAGNVQVLIDLRGPEVRIGKLNGDVAAEEGSRIVLTGGEGLAPVRPEPGPARPASASSYPEPGPARPASASSYPDPGPARPASASSYPEPGPARPASASSYPELVPAHPAPASPHPSPAHAGWLPIPEIVIAEAAVGDHILVDDGKIELVVEKKDKGIAAIVLRGGVIKSEKSLAIVGKELPMPTLTESDRKNIAQAAGYGVTGVMLPFVRNKEDLLTLREALGTAGAGHVKIFAKIENMRGVEAVDELLPYCDHVVIARGDLGNAMPLWKLPGVQKRLAAKCRAAGKPFMVVTQMLDSMHVRALPTRAEVLDIYNAVLDGAASLMLTGETAAGQYPVLAMEYLVKTGEEACYDMRSRCCLQR